MRYPTAACSGQAARLHPGRLSTPNIPRIKVWACFHVLRDKHASSRAPFLVRGERESESERARARHGVSSLAAATCSWAPGYIIYRYFKLACCVHAPPAAISRTLPYGIRTCATIFFFLCIVRNCSTQWMQSCVFRCVPSRSRG
jgi:hypothetical protein